MALSNILAIGGYLIKYLPLLLNLIHEAEATKESGTIKKASVMGYLKALFHIGVVESTGGSHESWEALETPFSMIVDALCTAFFGSKESVHFDDPSDM